jgi:hypothetical protein
MRSSAANDVLQGAVQGIAELITRPGLINVDFADVRTVMSETGMAMMGSGARPPARTARAWPPRPAVSLAAARGREPVGRARPADERGRRPDLAAAAVPRRRQHGRPRSSSKKNATIVMAT